MFKFPKNGYSRPFALIKLARSLQRYLSIKYFILFEQWGLQKLTTFDTPLDEGYTLGQVILSSLFAKTGRIISPGSEKQMKELFHLKEEKRCCCYSMWKCTIHMVFLTVKHMRVIRKEILFIGHDLSSCRSDVCCIGPRHVSRSIRTFFINNNVTYKRHRYWRRST